MMRSLITLSAIFALCACPHPGDASEISNFRSGIACPAQQTIGQPSPVSRICFDTNVVQITGQSTCTYNNQQLPCTWYGFEFDYADFPENAELSCKLTSNRMGDFGNPDGISQKNSAAYEYAISVPAGNGHFFNPQYSVFTYSNSEESIIEETTSCSLEGEELFRFERRLVYPERNSE